jgi:hypothetical protein
MHYPRLQRGDLKPDTVSKMNKRTMDDGGWILAKALFDTLTGP